MPWQGLRLGQDPENAGDFRKDSPHKTYCSLLALEGRRFLELGVSKSAKKGAKELPVLFWDM